ncbi:MAG: hypothetical protein M1835_002987 [Candelina submexicana]|nr:MAG: hypothetical protein M1835_002987 [Candelina submexicana]
MAVHSSLFDPAVIWRRWRDVILGNWYLGFTSFGGPPVHFQIFHKRFVDDKKWIDEQTIFWTSKGASQYQEIFTISQALPGPGSTKLLFFINIARGGFAAGLLAFLIWRSATSLPLLLLAQELLDHIKFTDSNP